MCPMTLASSEQLVWLVTVTSAPLTSGLAKLPPTARSVATAWMPETAMRREYFSHGVDLPLSVARKRVALLDATFLDGNGAVARKLPSAATVAVATIFVALR